MSGENSDVNMVLDTTNATDVSNVDVQTCEETVGGLESQNTLYQILLGIFAGLSLILFVVTIWVLVARRSGRNAPVAHIQGGFSLGSLGSMMSTS